MERSPDQVGIEGHQDCGNDEKHAHEVPSPAIRQPQRPAWIRVVPHEHAYPSPRLTGRLPRRNGASGAGTLIGPPDSDQRPGTAPGCRNRIASGSTCSAGPRPCIRDPAPPSRRKGSFGTGRRACKPCRTGNPRRTPSAPAHRRRRASFSPGFHGLISIPESFPSSTLTSKLASSCLGLRRSFQTLSFQIPAGTFGMRNFPSSPATP